jgi:hypothetical protein
MSMVYLPALRATTRTSTERLRPALALYTPAWLAALTVLIINDHLLKGADLLPGIMTGKFSDFAGMLVAPALLATLLRVRGRRALLLCHIAVGLVFAAINVSPAAAGLLTSMMGALAIPWTITLDPSDLLALPFLGISWLLFAPVMAHKSGAPTRRLVESTLLSAGVLASVATSYDAENFSDSDWSDSETGGYTPIEADVYVNNASETDDLVIRVRGLKPEAKGNCDVLAQDPGGLVTDGLLGEATTWTLPPGTNAAVRNTNTTASCYAVLVEIDALPPAMLFWHNGEIAVTGVEGLITAREDHLPGAIIVDRNQPGFAAYAAAPPSRLPQVPRAESELAQSPSCAPLDDGGRLAWTSLSAQTQRIIHLGLGIDGCVALHLDDGQGEPPAAPEDTPVDGYVCLPVNVTFPFAVGDEIGISQTKGFGSNPTFELTLNPDENNPAHTHAITMVLGIGDLAPFVSGTVMDFEDKGSCGPVASATCGTVVHRGELSVRFLDGQTYVLAVGTTATLGDDAESVEVHLVHAERRIALDPGCVLGPTNLGPALAVVAIPSEAR